MISDKRFFVEHTKASEEIRILKSIGLIPYINIVYESGQTGYSVGYFIRQ